MKGGGEYPDCANPRSGGRGDAQILQILRCAQISLAEIEKPPPPCFFIRSLLNMFLQYNHTECNSPKASVENLSAQWAIFWKKILNSYLLSPLKNHLSDNIFVN